MEQVLVVESLLVNVYTGIFNLKEFKILALPTERLFLVHVTTRGVIILIIIQQRNASSASGLASGQRKVSMDMKMICFEKYK